MMTSNTDRARWQRQAAHTLTEILRQHPRLPVIAWTITPVGICAHVSVPADPRRTEQVFTAWRTALHLPEQRHPHPEGTGHVHLHARGQFNGIRVSLTATTNLNQ